MTYSERAQQSIDRLDKKLQDAEISAANPPSMLPEFLRVATPTTRTSAYHVGMSTGALIGAFSAATMASALQGQVIASVVLAVMGTFAGALPLAYNARRGARLRSEQEGSSGPS